MHTLASTFALIDAHLPHALVTDVAHARLAAHAATLPAAIGRCLYVECPLDRPDAADLIVDVSEEGCAILAGLNARVAVSAAPTNTRWRRVATLARAWVHDDARLRRAIDGMWLEFDLHGAPDAAAPPNVFVDLSPDVYRAHSHAAALDALSRVAMVTGQPLTDAVRATIAAILTVQPGDAFLLYAGFMFARSHDAVRICIMGLARHDLRVLLTRIAWAGDIDRLVALTDDIAAPDGGGQDRPAIIHLDIDARGSASASPIGLEYPLSRRCQLAGRIAETALLESLVSRQLMTAAQWGAIDDWTGYACLTMPHELWPSILVRRVNHVKLVQAPARPLRAKAYLCAEHRRVRPSRGANAPSQ